MIEKITKLKSFGIFQDFQWHNDLPEFKKLNLIYGWNRSGKTTFSRVFASCEKKAIYDSVRFKQYPENGEFELVTADNVTVKSSTVSTNTLPIKVFNQDFIDDNISFDPSDTSNPIIYISEEDIESKKQHEKLKQEKIELDKKLESEKTNKRTKEDLKSGFLTSLGREVANILFDKTYNKTKAENKINSVGVENFGDKSLSDDLKAKNEEIARSKPEDEIELIKNLPVENWTFLHSRVKSLLERKIVAELLERLKKTEDKDGGLDEELNSWVKKGFDLHKEKNQFKKCLFCENELNSDLFDKLSKHFSKDYEELQLSIQLIVSEMKTKMLKPISEENYNLYSDLRNEYQSECKEYNRIVKELNSWLFETETLLDMKFRNPFDPDVPEMLDVPETFTDSLNVCIDKINLIIQKHNSRVKDHDREVKEAKEKLELHTIAEAIKQQDYKNMLVDVSNAVKNESDALSSVNENLTKIEELEKKTSNIGKAIIEINKHLIDFFGREEIELQLDDDKKGYIIKRDGQVAGTLSEGEKTAIAFSYFIVKVKENGFNLKNGIIYIDDPISSFDSNFIYHAFSLIKNNFNDVNQLIVSTHNFQFFNLIKDWFIRKNKNTEEENKERKLKGKTEKPLSCEFFMIKNEISEKRKAKLVVLDQTLKSYKSEYAFLFVILNDFVKKTEEPSFEEIYNISNIARRFFEIYADFKIPTNTKEPYDKLKLLVSDINTKKEEDAKITIVQVDKVFWLINGFSHNSDPTSMIEHRDKSESIEAVKVLLKILKESDQKHYEVLEKF